MENKKSTGAVVAIVGGVALAISPFMTWARVSFDLSVLARLLGVPAEAIGSIPGVTQSARGVDGWEGKAAIVAGIVAIVIAVLAMSQVRKGFGVLMIVAGLIGGGVALYDVATAKSQVREGFNQGLDEFRPQLQAAGIDTSALDDALVVSLAAGIWICMIAGIVVIAGGVMVRSGEGEPSAAGTSTGMGSDVGFSSPPPTPAATTTSAATMTQAPPAMPSTVPSPPAGASSDEPSSEGEADGGT